MEADDGPDSRLEVLVGGAVLLAGTALLAELLRQVDELDTTVRKLWLEGKRVAQNTAAGPLLGDTASSLTELRELLRQRGVVA